MIRASPRQQNPNLFASLSSLELTKSYRSSVQLTPLAIQNAHNRRTQYPSSTMIVDSNEFEKLKQIFEWRLKTEFPIVKIRSYTLPNEKQNFQCGLVEILVELQSTNKSLSEMNKLPFFQAIYVLKQSLIGFQRLCHHFGFFTPTIEMIKFNDKRNCKVWINEDCFSNSTNLGNVKCERQFVNQLCRIIENQTLKTRSSIQFFNKIKSCKHFFESICAIENYAKSNRIIIPTKVQNFQDSKSPLLKTSVTYKPIFIQKKNLMKSSKVPEFIKKNKVKKTISYDINAPVQRKMTACTEQILRDYSLTNISRNNSTNSFLKNDFSQKDIKKSEEEDHIEEDSFLKDMNIRLFEPDNNEKIYFVPSTPNLKSSFDENSPSTPTSPFGQVSQIFYQQERKSRLSFFNSPSHEQISPFETAQKLFLTVHKPTNYDETYSSSPKKKSQLSPRCIKTLQYLDDQQSIDGSQKQITSKNKFQPLSITQIRQKRKFSGDYFYLQSNKTNTECKLKDTNSSSVSPFRTQNVLNIPKNIESMSVLRRSPSHNVISTPKKRNSSEQDEKVETAEKQYLRETIMTKNGWKGLGLFVSPDSVKQSFIDGQQIPNMQSRTCDLPKLGKMGKIVKSSMISETEFQLQYGDRLEKQQCVRNELLNILN